jgi:hypothetical protein
MALDAKRKKLRDMWEEYIFKKNVQSYAHQNASLSAEDVVMAPFTVSRKSPPTSFSPSLSFCLSSIVLRRPKTSQSRPLPLSPSPPPPLPAARFRWQVVRIWNLSSVNS